MNKNSGLRYQAGFTEQDAGANEKTAVIFIGIPASGKSSFYARHFKETHIHINLDTLRTRDKESVLLSECLRKGKSFVVDRHGPRSVLNLDIALFFCYAPLNIFLDSVMELCGFLDGFVGFFFGRFHIILIVTCISQRACHLNCPA